MKEPLFERPTSSSDKLESSSPEHPSEHAPELQRISEKLILSSEARLQKLLAQVDGRLPDGSLLRSAILDAVLEVSAAYSGLYSKKSRKPLD